MKHNAQFETLKENFQRGTNAHAYLFFGGFGEERMDAARACAERMTGAGMEGINPDVLILARQEGEDTISIAQAREIQRFFSFKPYFGKGRMVIVDGIERMDEAAASALLKTLEEPPRSGALILLSDRPETILPTILSRVQRVRFFGTKEGIDKNNEMVYTLLGLMRAETAERLSMAERISKDERVDVEEILFRWTSFFRDLSYCALGAGEDIVAHSFCLPDMKKALKEKQYTPAQIGEILSELVRMSHALHVAHMNRRLVLEYVTLLL